MPAQSHLAAVLRVLDRVVERDGCHMACCPAHPDTTPSLSITEADGGRLLVHCFAGCDYPAIRDALVECGVDPAVFRLGTPRPGAVVAEYPYTDEDGTVLYVKQRRHPKEFRLKAPDGAGGWVHSQVLRTAPRRVLYRLPEVRAAIRAGRPVYVVEGEKDADTLAALGLAATCNVEGAAAPGQRTKWLAAYAEQLAGAATVIVVADKDRPGYAHAQAVAHCCTAPAATARAPSCGCSARWSARRTPPRSPRSRWTTTGSGPRCCTASWPTWSATWTRGPSRRPRRSSRSPGRTPSPRRPSTAPRSRSPAGR